MRRIFATLLVSAAAAFAATGAFAHAMLKHASPAAGQTLNAAPNGVRLEFSEALEPRFSRVSVQDGIGHEVTAGPAQIGGATMTVPLKPLPPGAYVVRWRALSVDTHETQGAYSFTVR